MRYLILFFTFLSPITLLAQIEGTVEYSMTTEMKMDMETIMANMPEEMQADSAMVAQMAQSFENMGNQQATVTMLLHFSGAQALMEMVMPDLPNPLPNVSPFGSFDNSMAMTSYFDFEEQTSLTRMPNTGESVPYVVSRKMEELDWVLVDVDSTILGHAVKKAEFVVGFCRGRCMVCTRYCINRRARAVWQPSGPPIIIRRLNDTKYVHENEHCC